MEVVEGVMALGEASGRSRGSGNTVPRGMPGHTEGDPDPPVLKPPGCGGQTEVEEKRSLGWRLEEVGGQVVKRMEVPGGREEEEEAVGPPSKDSK